MKTPLFRAMWILCFVPIPFFTTGCVQTHFKHPSGLELNRTAVGTGTNLAELQIPTPDGPVIIRGYSSEQAQVAGAAVEAAVTAVLKQRAPEARSAK